MYRIYRKWYALPRILRFLIGVVVGVSSLAVFMYFAMWVGPGLEKVLGVIGPIGIAVGVVMILVFVGLAIMLYRRRPR